MSSVTGVVLCTSVCEQPTDDDDDRGPCWAAVQAWLVEHSFAPLAFVDLHFSGTKAPQMIVGGGGFNHFPASEFAAFVLALDWDEPGNVVLAMEPEEGASSVHRPQGYWHAVEPGDAP